MTTSAPHKAPAKKPAAKKPAAKPSPSAAKAIERLFWRAGFGPTPGDRAKFANAGLRAAVESLVAPKGPMFAGAQMTWRDGKDQPVRKLDSAALNGDDNWSIEILWWLDKMVRTKQPLVERMTLNLHDHFATSMSKVNDRNAMIAQNELLRRFALGNFRDLCKQMWRDRAMQQWLDIVWSDKKDPNENFGREFMELFTIGMAYEQSDVVNMARCFTGVTFDWDTKEYGFDPKRYDDGVKTILGKTGRFGPDDAVDICLDHPAHAPFFMRKLWSYFIPSEPSAATLNNLVSIYRGSNLELRPVLRAILLDKAMYSNLDQPDMVKPPVVYVAGALRTLKPKHLPGGARWWFDQLGQAPFFPPHVGGWAQGPAFLSTGTLKARWEAMGYLLDAGMPDDKQLPKDETAAASLAAVLRRLGNPPLSPTVRNAVNKYAGSVTRRNTWDHATAERRRGIQQLIMAGPEAQLH